MSADGRGREWSRRCFFGYGLGPTSLARSLARQTDVNGRTDATAANRADFTVVLLRDRRGGRRRRPPLLASRTRAPSTALSSADRR